MIQVPNPLSRVVTRFFALLVSMLFLAAPAAEASITVLDYYRMGEGDPTANGVVFTLPDSVGSKPLTTSGGPFYSSDVSPEAAARIGGSRSLFLFGNAANDNGTPGNGTLVSTATNNFGVEAWVKPTLNGGDRIIVYNGNTLSSGWGIIQSGTVVKGIFGGVTLFGSVNLPLSTWSHVALVRDNGTATLYVNGVPAGTTSSVPNVASGAFAVGAAPPTPTASGFFSGNIDEVRVFTFTAGQFTTDDLLWRAPDISIQQPVGTAIADGGAKGFGSVTAGSNTTLTFSIANTGLSNLLLGGSPRVAVSGTNASDFTVTSQPPASVAGMTVTNAGFETPAFAANGWSYSTAAADGWTFGSAAGIARNGSPWFVNAAPEGSQAGFLQMGSVNAIMSRTVNFPSTGTYVISFWAVRRAAAYPATDIEVRLDGTAVGSVTNTSLPDDTWRNFTVSYSCTTAGNHTLAFAGTRNGADYCSAIDDIQILGANSTFQVSFAPLGSGPRTAALSIASNDPDETPYDINLSGIGVAPEIAVFTGASTAAIDERADNSGTYTFDGTLVGSSSTAQTFTLKNTGTANLTGLALSISGSNPGEFTTGSLGATTLAPNATTTFTVTFSPAASGLRNGVINIASNDPDENPFEIVVAGTGVAAVPEIAVFKGANTLVANELFDNTGTQVLPATILGNSAAPQFFTIKNTGTANLIGSGVTIGGANPGDFTLTASSFNLAPNATTTISVVFSPTAAGSRSATISIASNDPDEAAFRIKLGATGLSQPDIAVIPGTNPATPDLVNNAGTFAMPNAAPGRTGVQVFTIRNSGNLALTGLAPSLSGTNGSFAVSALGSTTLAAATTTTFSVTFSPSALGAHTATLSIASNDPDENPFKINLTGSGIAPEISVEQPAGTEIGGEVVAWGSNDYGQTDIPAGLLNVRSISASPYHSVALKTDGTVVCWGYNKYGQCDVPPGLTGVIAVDAGYDHTLALKGDGTVVAWGDGEDGQLAIPAGLNNVVAISAGGFHNLAVRSNGTIVGWGNNQYGQATPPGNLSGVVAAAGGQEWSLALFSDGTVFGWGRSDDGQLNIPASLSGVVAISTTDSHVLALKSDGTVVAWGKISGGRTNVPAGLVNVAGVAAGINHSAALKSDGSVVSWPGGYSAPAGLPKLVAISAGSDTIRLTAPSLHFADQAVATSSSPKTFTIRNTGIDPLAISGISVSGGNPGDFVIDTTGTATSVPSGGSTTFTVTFNPSAGGPRQTTLTILNDDQNEGSFTVNLSGTGITPDILIEAPAGVPALTSTVAVWGTNEDGQKNIPADLAGVKEIAVGEFHLIALKNDGSLIGWGNTDQGTTETPAGLTGVSKLAAGALFNLALKTDGTVAAWGYNSSGQCNVPADLTGVTAIAAGYSHSVALKSDGTVVAWGDNSQGQTNVPGGLSNVIAIATDTDHTLALKSDGTVVAWGYNYYGQSTPPPSLANVVKIAASLYGSTAIKADGTIVTWGNFYGAPGSILDVAQLVSGAYFNLAFRNDGTVATWGENSYGVLDIPAGLLGLKKFAAKSLNTAAILDATVSFGTQGTATPGPAKTFTIRNTGPAPLNLGAVSVTGGNASDFTVNTSGMASTVPSGGSTTFTVSFNAAAVGLRQTGLRVLSNDPDEAVYSLVLSGAGIVLAPEIAVFTAAGTPLADGATKDFGTVFVGANQALDFLLRNTGSGDLLLTGTPRVAVSGDNATEFTVTLQPQQAILQPSRAIESGFETPALDGSGFSYTPASLVWSYGGTAGVARNGSPWFVNPAPEGSQAAFIQRKNNGGSATLSQNVNFPAAGDYLIRFSLVRRGGGFQATDVDVNVDGSLLGSVPNAVLSDDGWRSFSVPYHCTTGGAHLLSFVGTRNDLADCATAIDDVQIDGGPNPPISSTNFQITFTPSSTGTRTATVTIASNDSDENPYHFFLSGDGLQLTALEAWRQLYFNSTANAANGANDADPNHNGIPNLLEYALGGNPSGNTTGISILPSVSLDASHHLQLSFNRFTDRTGITLTIQASDTLAGTWVDLCSSVDGAAFVPINNGATINETGSGSTRSVLITDSIATTDPLHPKRFLRLSVTTP